MKCSNSCKLGYLVPQFPTQTHAFFWREANALATLIGHPVQWISTAKPPADSCRHSFAEDARNRTFYMFPPSIKGLLTVAQHPKRLLRAVNYILQLEETPKKEKLKLLGLLACVGKLIDHCKEKGIRHVHGHSLGNTMHILAMAHIIDGLTFSGTLHGQPALYGVDFAAKCRYAQFVSCVTSLNCKELALETGKPPESYPITIMGVDTHDFEPPPRETNIATLRLISVSRLSLSKSHDVTLRAVAHAITSTDTTLHYTIVGDGEQREAIEQQVLELGLQNHVTMTGSLGEHEVKEQLASHDIFVLSSVGTEAAPVAIMEAMSMGLTVLSSRIGGTPDMIKHGETGYLFDQGDWQHLSKLLQTLAQERSTLHTIGQTARAYAIEHFDYRRTAEALYQYLKPHLSQP